MLRSTLKHPAGTGGEQRVEVGHDAVRVHKGILSAAGCKYIAHDLSAGVDAKGVAGGYPRGCRGRSICAAPGLFQFDAEGPSLGAGSEAVQTRTKEIDRLLNSGADEGLAVTTDSNLL
jgi:hypothetical protein